MGRATGVQITGSAVRVVDLEGSGKKFRVRGVGEASIGAGEGADRAASLSKAVKEAFKSSKASREHVVLGLPTRDCVIREITIPFTDKEQIKKVVKFEAEPHLHSCSIDDVVIAFHKVSEHNGRSTILVVAARKTLITECLRALESNGIDPLQVDIDASGLFTLAHVFPETAEKSNYVVCEIGYTSTMITLVKNGDLRIVRSVRMGTNSIISRVGKELELDHAEARTRTHEILLADDSRDDDLFVQRGDVEEIGSETTKSAGELERDMVRQRQDELVTRLHQEIYRSINPAKLTEPLEGVYLTGPGSSLRRLRADLEVKFDCPVKRLEVLDWFDHKIATNEIEVYDAFIPVAAGLALEFIGENPLRMDFRQEEFVFAKRFDRLKVPLFCLVLLVTALNGLWFFTESQRAVQKVGMVKQLGMMADPIFEDVANPKEIPRDLLEKYPAPYNDPAVLEKAYVGQKPFVERGLDRIRYMGRTVTDIHEKLRSAYGLDADARNSRRGLTPGGGRGGEKPLPNASDYTSALETAQYVMQAIRAPGVRDIAINRFTATPQEVLFSITIPKTADTVEGPRSFLEIYGMIENYLKALPPEARFVKLDDRTQYKQDENYKEGEAVIYPVIAAEFARERL